MLVLALGSIKLSFMFFYRRVFRTGDSKAFDRVMFSVVAIIVAWTASFFFALMFEYSLTGRNTRLPKKSTHDAGGSCNKSVQYWPSNHPNAA